MTSAPKPAAAKIHHAMSLRYSYFCSHQFMPHHANGIPNNKEIPTSITKSLLSMPHKVKHAGAHYFAHTNFFGALLSYKTGQP